VVKPRRTNNKQQTFNMELSEIIPHVEALMFASDKPLSNAEVLELVNSALALIEDRATAEQINAAIEGIGEKYNSELFNTAIEYIEKDGKINETAQALFLHKNTIRYRLGKIKELLNMEDYEGRFYEELSLAIKVYKIYNN